VLDQFVPGPNDLAQAPRQGRRAEEQPRRACLAGSTGGVAGGGDGQEGGDGLTEVVEGVGGAVAEHPQRDRNGEQHCDDACRHGRQPEPVH
jgi:hypothetical protein